MPMHYALCTSQVGLDTDDKVVCHSKPTQCQHLRWEVACSDVANHFVWRIFGQLGL